MNITDIKQVTWRIILRSNYDEDMYHLAYSWRSPNGKLLKRLACTIHIDDIEGMFGEKTYLTAKDIKPGGWDWMPSED